MKKLLLIIAVFIGCGSDNSEPQPEPTITPTATATPTPIFPPEIPYDEACAMCEDEEGLAMLGFRLTNISIETAMEICKMDLACER
jgi:hypothetical protein